MPFWMTTIWPVQSMWGWALVCEGLPWVAQRVWPMPIWPAIGSASRSTAQVDQLADVAADGDFAILDDGDARRVVASILEAFESFKDDGGRLAGPHVADDAAHVVVPPVGRGAGGEACSRSSLAPAGQTRNLPALVVRRTDHCAALCPAGCPTDLCGALFPGGEDTDRGRGPGGIR